MHSQFGHLLAALLASMPIITQPISQHIASRAYLCTADRTTVTQTLYFCFGLVIPKVHHTVRSCSHKPAVFNGIKSNRVYGVQNSLIGYLFFIAFEGYLRFLHYWCITELQSPFRVLQMVEILARPSIDPTPNALPLGVRAIDQIWEVFPSSLESITERVLILVASTIIIFQSAVAATTVGNKQSQAYTLFAASIDSTGDGMLPGCQKYTLFQQPVATSTFWRGAK